MFALVDQRTSAVLDFLPGGPHELLLVDDGSLGPDHDFARDCGSKRSKTDCDFFITEFRLLAKESEGDDSIEVELVKPILGPTSAGVLHHRPNAQFGDCIELHVEALADHAKTSELAGRLLAELIHKALRKDADAWHRYRGRRNTDFSCLPRRGSSAALPRNATGIRIGSF